MTQKEEQTSCPVYSMVSGKAILVRLNYYSPQMTSSCLITERLGWMLKCWISAEHLAMCPMRTSQGSWHTMESKAPCNSGTEPSWPKGWFGQSGWSIFPSHQNIVTSSLRHCMAVSRWLSDIARHHLWRGPADLSEGPIYTLRLGREMGHEVHLNECNILRISHERQRKCFYTICGEILQGVQEIKYLGVTISNNLKWQKHKTAKTSRANSSYTSSQEHHNTAQRVPTNWPISH